jgi:transposase-like protein
MTVLTTVSRRGAHAGVVTDHPSGEVPERAKRRTFTAAYKLRIVEEYEDAEPGARGEVLRREGLYSSHLTEWRKARDIGALAGLAATRGRPPADPVERDNQRLRDRNSRLEAELDTARRVIEVQGKVSALLEELSGRAHDASEASTPWRSGPSSPPRSSR